MKRVLFALSIVIALLISGCGEVSTTNSGDSTAPVKQGETTKESGESTDPTKQEEAAKENVILDNDTIKATYNGVTDMPDIGYFYVNLKIENKIDKEIWVSLEGGDVDGETVPMIITGMPVYIRSGNSSNATFGFPMAKLSISSVKDAKQVTFNIHIRDKENITETIFKSDLITIDLNK